MREIKAVCWSRFDRHQHWRILSKLFDMNTSQWLNHGESLNSLFLLTESNTHSFSILNHGTGVYNLCRRENCLLPKGIIIGIIGIIIISPHHHCHIVVMRQKCSTKSHNSIAVVVCWANNELFGSDLLLLPVLQPTIHEPNQWWVHKSSARLFWNAMCSSGAVSPASCQQGGKSSLVVHVMTVVKHPGALAIMVWKITKRLADLFSWYQATCTRGLGPCWFSYGSQLCWSQSHSPHNHPKANFSKFFDQPKFCASQFLKETSVAVKPDMLATTMWHDHLIGSKRDLLIGSNNLNSDARFAAMTDAFSTGGKTEIK